MEKNQTILAFGVIGFFFGIVVGVVVTTHTVGLAAL